MMPPYDITQKILELIASISEKIGAVNASFLDKQSPQLRKQNQIKTIHSSLQIEGNTLSEAQITALIENRRVLGPQKDIREVLNAIKGIIICTSISQYLKMISLKPTSSLWQDWLKNPGRTGRRA